MKALTLMQKQDFSVRKSIRYVGVSNNMLYASKKPRTSKSTKKSQK